MKSSNPKAYWDMLNRKSGNVIEPSLEELGAHFAGLSDADHEGSAVPDENTTQTQLDTEILNAPITAEEIQKECHKLKNNKSPGEDKIINEYIKASMPSLTHIYVMIFNKILDTGIFPEAWSSGVIVPIYKNKGDRNDCNNYRGITLLSCMGKLFTSILNTRLQTYCKTNNIIVCCC